MKQGAYPVDRLLVLVISNNKMLRLAIIAVHKADKIFFVKGFNAEIVLIQIIYVICIFYNQHDFGFGIF